VKPVLFRYLCSMLLLGCTSFAFAQADQMLPPIGGPGGGQYIARCAIDEILNGVELRTGDDVDGIRAICATPVSPSAIGPRNRHSSTAGGPGGGVVSVVCPDSTPVIAGFLVGWEGVSTLIVNNIRLYCSTAVVNQPPAPYPTVSFDGPEARSNGSFRMPLQMQMQRCPDGLVPVGINGRSGKWVDSVGLICGVLPLAPPAPPKPAVPARPKVTANAGPPFKMLVEWTRPVPADFIEWYSIELWKDQRWVPVPGRIDPRQFRTIVQYPDLGDASQRQAFRVCAENSAHRACSPEAWYYAFSTGSAQLSDKVDRAIPVPPRPIEVKPNGTFAQARAAAAPAATAPATANYSRNGALAQAAGVAATPLPDLNALAARGAALALQDPLAAELRNRTPEGPVRRGFDVGFGIWEGNTVPGPAKQRVHDALSSAEQPGFDIAAAISLPRNKYAALAKVGAAIGNADPAVAGARNAENDVFYWLGFDIASGIFGDPKAGAQGNTATGPGSLGIRNELNASAQRGFNASTQLHLSRKYAP